MTEEEVKQWPVGSLGDVYQNVEKERLEERDLHFALQILSLVIDRNLIGYSCNKKHMSEFQKAIIALCKEQL